MIEAIKTNIKARQHDGEQDRADAVQTVLIVAGFAIVVILILAWIGKALKNKGAQAANCIDNADTYGTESTAHATETCDSHVGTYVSDDDSYTAQQQPEQ